MRETLASSVYAVWKRSRAACTTWTAGEGRRERDAEDAREHQRPLHGALRDAKVVPQEIDHRRVVRLYGRAAPRALARLCDLRHFVEFRALRHDLTLRLHEGRQV